RSSDLDDTEEESDEESAALVASANLEELRQKTSCHLHKSRYVHY
ncbi:hypothetical protein SASC598O02_001210, partial [Snodgrassella alvi SCGC AB-598-O02]